MGFELFPKAPRARLRRIKIYVFGSLAIFFSRPIYDIGCMILGGLRFPAIPWKNQSQSSTEQKYDHDQGTCVACSMARSVNLCVLFFSFNLCHIINSLR